MKKRILCGIISSAVMAASLFGCAGNTAVSDEPEAAVEDHEPVAKIGVALWSSTDVLGSRCRELLYYAADALDVELEFEDHGFSQTDEVAAVERLIADGCQGIVICNSSDEVMDSVIDLCDGSGTYLAQCFRTIDRTDSPGVYAKAEESSYYVGCVHENEIENGRNTAQMILNLGNKRIGVIGWVPDDVAWKLRYEGYSIAVDGANSINRENKVNLLEPVYAGITYEGGYSAVEKLLDIEPSMDALIVAGGGGEPLVGALAALSDKGRSGIVDVVATGFIDDLNERMKKGTMVGASGGNHCDCLMAFMMVYNAILGTDSYTDLSGTYNEVVFPYLYAISPQDYVEFDEGFYRKSPYSEKGYKKLSKLSVEGLKEEAVKIKKKW
ncbi:MAG: substrate-binding domain-containing protein [Lachnospiraceae bacterium]|nr:substrate-binding domain-containing protein [Lachnospiraceae bacterium]